MEVDLEELSTSKAYSSEHEVVVDASKALQRCAHAVQVYFDSSGVMEGE